MNPTVDNDLQKAIDDITKNTNQDPVFADPVAAPSSIPEGDTGELASPVGPFPNPEPFAAPAPAPMNVPVDMPAPEAAPEVVPETVPETIAAPEPIAAPIPDMPAPEMMMPEMPTETAAPASDMADVKNAVLRDLAPIVGKIDMDPSKKFKLYKEIREDLHDDSVIAPAYETAREIADETERADALLYIYDSLK